MVSQQLRPAPWKLEAVRKAVAFYVPWWRAHKTPALVGGHTAAYAEAYLLTAEKPFADAVCEEGDCGMLLDVNNVHVNSVNHGYDAWEMLSRMPLHRVVQLHLAGPEPRGQLLLDTHGSAIQPAVWDLTERLLPLLGPTSALVEWDNNMPPLERLLEEHAKVAALFDRAFSPAGKAP